MKATYRVEGDHPTAAIMLREYEMISAALRAACAKSPYKQIQSMIHRMLGKIHGYQREAIECDAIALATLLNPRLRMTYIENQFPTDQTRIQELIKSHFNSYKEECIAEGGCTDTTETAIVETSSDPHLAETCNPKARDLTSMSIKSELGKYLDWDHDCSDPKMTMLNWWNVCVSGSSFLR